MKKLVQGSALIIGFSIAFTFFPIAAFAAGGGPEGTRDECNQLCDMYILKETYLAKKEGRPERPPAELTSESTITRWTQELGKVKSEAMKKTGASQKPGSSVR